MKIKIQTKNVKLRTILSTNFKRQFTPKIEINSNKQWNTSFQQYRLKFVDTLCQINFAEKITNMLYDSDVAIHRSRRTIAERTKRILRRGTFWKNYVGWRNVSTIFFFLFYTRFEGMMNKNNKQFKLCCLPVISWNLLVKCIIL